VKENRIEFVEVLMKFIHVKMLESMDMMLFFLGNWQKKAKMKRELQHFPAKQIAI
jgi:hypothetical protein